MKVCVVIVNWNGWADTIECLESLFRCCYQDFRVVIADNGSDDGSVERIRAWAEGRLDAVPARAATLRSFSYPPVPKPIGISEYELDDVENREVRRDDSPIVLIRNGGNLGFAGGNNVAIRYALRQGDCDFLWLLNNDTVVAAEAMVRLVEVMRERPDAGMCGSTILYYENPDRVQALGGGWHSTWIGLPWHHGRFRRADAPIDAKRAEAWMNYVEGASLFVSRRFVETVGLMCEDYFLFFEETDWAVRAKGRFTLAYAPQSVVYHKVGASIGTSSNPGTKSFTCDYYSVRNRLLFTRRYYPYALPGIYLVLAGALLLRVLLGKWERARMILKLMAGHDDHGMPHCSGSRCHGAA